MYTPMTSRASKYLQEFETAGYTSTAKQGSAQAQQQAPVDDGRFTNRKTELFNAGTRSGSSSGPTASTTRTRTIRKGDAPEAPDLPTFQAPEFNKRAVRAMTQKMAAPGVRTLRETMQQAMGKNYENPNVRKLTLREALQGYGTGLDKVMAGASREARSEHMAELDIKREAEMANFKAQTNAAMQQYQNAWADYLKGEETVQTYTPTAEDGQPTGGVNMMGANFRYSRNPISGNIRPI